MNKNFKDKYMDIQSGLIAPFMEVTKAERHGWNYKDEKEFNKQIMKIGKML